MTRDGKHPEDTSARGAQKVDPSVSEYDQYLTGEPNGSVPLERTMRKPDAYYPARPGPK